MKNPKVSIILPIYNVEPYLKKCIDSVISQTLLDIEIILATDGPESCDEICREYAKKDHRIHIIFHPGSYGKAFNQALKLASGEYVGIVETDDWCDVCMFEKLYKRAVSTRADIVKCYFYDAYNNRNLLKVTYDWAPDVFNINDLPQFMSYQPAVWSAIYNRFFLINNNITMIEDRISFIDAHFHVETAIRADKIALIKEPLYFYFHGNPTQSVKSTCNVKDGISADRITYERIKKLLKIDNTLLRGFMLATILHLMWNYNNIGKDKLQEFWNSARDYMLMLNSDISIDLSFCNDLQRKFFYFLINDETYKTFAKNRRKNNWLICKNFPFLKVIYYKNITKGYIFNIPVASKTITDTHAIYKIFGIISIRGR
jgi:glycosyltransferase involved in cell wall biosynthesis